MSSRIKIVETELGTFTKELLEALPQCTGATVLALSGDLGAGKTTLVQKLANTMGVTEVVSSPTFVLQKIYDTTHKRFTTLVHIDLYRLENPQEIAVLQLEEWAKDPDTLLCVEWPERVVTWPERLCVHPVQLTAITPTQHEIFLKDLLLPSYES